VFSKLLSLDVAGVSSKLLSLDVAEVFVSGKIRIDAGADVRIEHPVAAGVFLPGTNIVKQLDSL
jgi:hypothetical protein